MKIYIGSDHGGYELKYKIIKELQDCNYEIIDAGYYNSTTSDYPDIASLVCNLVLNNRDSIGILICGTGIGMSIAANKINNIRCALCNDLFSAEMAKKHNNANIIALGARIIATELSFLIIKKYLETTFENRHQNRINKIHKLER